MTEEQNPKLVRRVVHKAPAGGIFTRGPGWHLQAVFGPDGAIQLFDIYVENEWRGSKRTEKQCHDFLRQHGLAAPEYL
jgi:hypothetical protein